MGLRRFIALREIRAAIRVTAFGMWWADSARRRSAKNSANNFEGQK